MSFTIEFQPMGIRLLCNDPLTLLDASRQAGIGLRSDCGAAGICGKCIVQIIQTSSEFPPTDIERTYLSNIQLSDGFHLACETVINDDLKVQVPAESLTIGQVLQVEGSGNVAQPDALICQKTVKLREPALNDLDSDLSRLQKASNIIPLNVGWI